MRFGSFVEVALTPPDHTVFLSIRLSLKLGHANSLQLVEEGLTRAFVARPVHHISPHQQRRWLGEWGTLVHKLLVLLGS